MSESAKGRILIADDSRFFLLSLQRLLENEGYEVIPAEDGRVAVESARAHRPDLVLLDVEMPRLDGIDACRKIKEIPETAHIPVLFCTGQASSDIRLRGLRAGGEEYLTKPFIPEEILAQVAKFMKRVRSTLSLIDRVKILEEERTELQQRLSAVSSEDTLAQAFRITPTNKLHVISEVDDSLISFVRDNPQFVILYVAVDNMDRVDMLFGSEMVFEAQSFLFNKIVEYLRELAADLSAIRICRNMADDLVVFLPDPLLARLKLDSNTITDFGADVVRHIRFGMESQFVKKEVGAVLGIATGVSWVSSTPRLSFHRQILSAIKEASDGAYNFQTKGRQKLHLRLKEMIRTGSIRVVYQPIVRSLDGRIDAYEALSRGQYPELERPPLMFDVAEECRETVSLSRLCRKKALKRFKEISESHRLFLNFHPDDFQDGQILAESPAEPIFQAPPGRIVIEITERSAIKDAQKLKETIDFLKKRGFKIAIDDLGTGYTSLALIASLNPDYIKFDMSLIRGIDLSPTKQALLKTLVQFARDVGATSVAEGIETGEELEVVREFKCDLCQGFYFSPPRDHFVNESEFSFAK